MTVRFYAAIIERGEEPGFGVTFPDFPGCVSAGDTVQQAAMNAEEALRGHIGLMIQDGDPIPMPMPLDEVPSDPEVREAARLLVRIDFPVELVAA